MVELAVATFFLGFQLNNFFYADDIFHLAYVRFTTAPFKTLWHYYLGEAFWRPFTILSDLLAFKLFTQNPAGWHLIDLLLLSLDAFLLSVLCYQVLKKNKPEEAGADRDLIFASAFCGMIFILHPVALITGAWTACRADVLGGVFALLSLLLLAREIKKEKISIRSLALAQPLAIFAYFCKESYFFLPLLAPALVIFSPGRRKVLVFLSFALGFLVYLGLRLSLFGRFGGYEEFELSLSWLLPRFFYHFPRVIKKSLWDFIFWRAEPRSFAYHWILWSLLGFLILSLPALARSLKLVFFSLCWMLFSLLPAWNLSHMFFYGESRLIFFSWMGFSLLLGGIVYQLRGWGMRSLGIVLLVPFVFLSGRAGWRELFQLQERSEEQKLVRDMLLSRTAELKDIKRIYVLGLDFDYYYLDPMLKVKEPSLGDKLFIPVGIEGFAWVKTEHLKEFLAGEKIEFLPRVKIFYQGDSWANISANTVEDLILARLNDPQAGFFEWKEKRLVEIGTELFQLAQKRSFFQQRFQHRLRLLPSYSFLKRNYPLKWELSENLELVIPAHLGEPYRFIAHNNDPYLVSPGLSFPSLGAGVLEIKMRIQPRTYLPPQEQSGCFYWLSQEGQEWSSEREICFPIIADGEFHTYRISLEANLNWLRSRKITRIRLDPISFAGWFELESIQFLAKPGNLE